MMDTNNAAMSGEARLQARRAAFWRYTFFAFAVALVVGGITGFAQDQVRAGTIPAWALVAFWAFIVGWFIWFTIGYFKRVDELDLQDNLWAAIAGFYFYAAALPSWYLFYDVGVLGEPNQYVIYGAAMVVMFTVYGLRKLGLR